MNVIAYSEAFGHFVEMIEKVGPVNFPVWRGLAAQG
jgi:hypothetical protein